MRPKNNLISEVTVLALVLPTHAFDEDCPGNARILYVIAVSVELGKDTSKKHGKIRLENTGCPIWS